MAEQIDRVGQRFGDYWLRRRLGGGGFGDVYLGEQVQEHSLAAVKVLQIRLTQSKELREFINEVRTFRLQHPHIVRLLDVGIAEDDTPFLVMEYAPFGTLRDRHPKDSQLPLTTVLTYVPPIASALQYAHDRKVIHRDVKPENMLLGPEGQVWLSDFGIAVVAHSTHSLRAHQGVGGTLPYMAPEQIHGEPRPASDQYALGIVVYEWLCGRRPFAGTMVELIAKHSTVLPVPLRTHVPTLSAAVEQVVLTTLSKDPKDRFGSVQAFATALMQAAQAPLEQAVPPEKSMKSSRTIEHSWGGGVVEAEQQQARHSESTGQETKDILLSSLPADIVSESSPGSSPASSEIVTSSVTPSPPLPDTSSHPSADQSAASGISVVAEPHVPPVRRGFSRREVLGGLAVLTVAGGGVIWWRISQNAPEGTLLYTYKGHTNHLDAVAWSPDGSRIASASGDYTVQVWNAVDGGNVYTYKRHTDVVKAVVWSPDGKRIASAGDKTVQVWDAADGGNVYTYKGHTEAVFAVAWSPDGQHIASGSGDKTVQVWDAADGKNAFTYRGHSDFVVAVAWSPDGKRITSGSFDKTVQVWNAADGGNAFTYRGHSDFVVAVAWSPDGKRIASGSGDKTVQVWNAADGGNIYTYKGHANSRFGSVIAVAWSPDGKRIASAISADKTVQVWQAVSL